MLLFSSALNHSYAVGGGGFVALDMHKLAGNRFPPGCSLRDGRGLAALTVRAEY